MWKPVQIPQHNTQGKSNKNTDKEKGMIHLRTTLGKRRKCEKRRWRHEKSLKLTNDSQGSRQVTRKVTTWREPSEEKPLLPERWYLHQHLAVTSDTRKVINYAPTATTTATRGNSGTQRRNTKARPVHVEIATRKLAKKVRTKVCSNFPSINSPQSSWD